MKFNRNCVIFATVIAVWIIRGYLGDGGLNIVIPDVITITNPYLAYPIMFFIWYALAYCFALPIMLSFEFFEISLTSAVVVDFVGLVFVCNIFCWKHSKLPYIIMGAMMAISAFGTVCWLINLISDIFDLVIYHFRKTRGKIR